MEPNGISEENEGRNAVLGLYFSVRSFICLCARPNGTVQTLRHLDGQIDRMGFP